MENYIYARTNTGLVIGELASGGSGTRIFPVFPVKGTVAMGAYSYAKPLGLTDTYAQSAFWAFRCTGCHRLIAGNHDFANKKLGPAVVPKPQGKLLCEEVSKLSLELPANSDVVLNLLQGFKESIGENYKEGCYVGGHDCWVHMRPCFPLHGSSGECKGSHGGLPPKDRTCQVCENGEPSGDHRGGSDGGNPFDYLFDVP
jgi:hypothetical protein